ncbi:MAG TPA: hypothetical protein VFS21_17945 [Roseiflexaceae bacterium]|nr:hypothetical protein [Roseiflexaceae bacterium]
MPVVKPVYEGVAMSSSDESQSQPPQDDTAKLFSGAQSPDEVIKIIYTVHAKAMTDLQVREEYIRNPRQVLEAHGLKLPDGITFSVIDRSRMDEYAETRKSTETHIYLAIPVAEEIVQANMVLSGSNPAGTSGTPCTS